MRAEKIGAAGKCFKITLYHYLFKCPPAQRCIYFQRYCSPCLGIVLHPGVAIKSKPSCNGKFILANKTQINTKYFSNGQIEAQSVFSDSGKMILEDKYPTPFDDAGSRTFYREDGDKSGGYPIDRKGNAVNPI